MREARWFRRAGPGIVIAAALMAGASATAGAPPPPWDPPPCDGWPGTADQVAAWYRLDPVLADGARVGQRLTLGRSGADGPSHVDLDAESFASGPYESTVLIGTDDRTATTLALIDLARGCRHDIARATDVVRHAVLTPERDAIVEFRVDRRSRRDLGVWRRPIGGGDATRIVGSLPTDARFGPTWLTTLGWAADGRTLVVESCAEVACRYRMVDPTTRHTRLWADPGLGSLVGVVGDRLVARGACRGMPCPVVSVDLRDGRMVTLDDAGGQAVLARDRAGQPIVVLEVGADGDLRTVGLDGRHLGPIELPAGLRLVGPSAASGSPATAANDWIVLSPDGSIPLDGAHALARHMGDGRTVALDEVTR